MINKCLDSLDEAVADLQDGDVVLVGGFGGGGLPRGLIAAVARSAVKDLTVVSNNVGAVGEGVAEWIGNRQVRKIICTFPVGPHAAHLVRLLEAREIELELCPQGTLAERIRAGGAGIAAFYTAVGVGTELADGKPTLLIDGQTFLLETAITGDFALIRADKTDRWGNLTYDKAQRNFNPVMATAATVTVAEVDEIGALGSIDPSVVVTPSIFVDRVVLSDDRASARDEAVS